MHGYSQRPFYILSPFLNTPEGLKWAPVIMLMLGYGLYPKGYGLYPKGCGEDSMTYMPYQQHCLVLNLMILG